MRVLCYIFLLLFCTIVAAQANNNNFSPNLDPSLNIPFTQKEINIDGNLNDPAWLEAGEVSNFAETDPGDLVQPEVNTTVKITYDNENLYLAFICEDDPEAVRASLQDRDNIWRDDYVGILLDTYGDATWAYFLFANPLGIQGDSRFSTASGEDEGFDVIYASEGKITDNGFQVEMAIPFSSLRFPDVQEQNWKINFWRNRPREHRYRYSWSAIDRDDPCFLCQYGTVTGLRGIEAGSPVELLPYITASKANLPKDADNLNAGLKDGSINGDVGGSFKWAATPSLTVEGTFNPDFSQVESDASQIDVNTTFALFFPERRPFFQEGSDLFDSWHTIVYTRSINDPQFASKVVGRWGNSTLAYLGAVDENTPIILPFEERSRFVGADRSLSNIVRFKHNFGDSRYVGAMISDRRLDNGYFTNFSVDAVYRFLDNYQLEFQAVSSHTEEPNDTSLTSGFNTTTFDKGKKTAGFDGENYAGNAIYASFERSARHWNLDLDFWQASPAFRAGNGFITQNNYRRGIIWTGYQFYYEDHPVLDRLNPFFSVGRMWNFSGTTKDEWFQPGVWARLKGQTNVEVSYLFNTERFMEKEFSDINRFALWIDSRFSDPLSVGMFFRTGRSIARRDLVKGEGSDFELWATIKPTNRLVIQPSFRHSHLDSLNGKEIFSGYITRIATNFQFTRELYLRLIFEYNDFGESISVEPLLSYKINPFTIFYIGMTHGSREVSSKDIRYPIVEGNWADRSQQFFAKFQYLVQL